MLWPNPKRIIDSKILKFKQAQEIRKTRALLKTNQKISEETEQQLLNESLMNYMQLEEDYISELAKRQGISFKDFQSSSFAQDSIKSVQKQYSDASIQYDKVPHYLKHKSTETSTETIIKRPKNRREVNIYKDDHSKSTQNSHSILIDSESISSASQSFGPIKQIQPKIIEKIPPPIVLKQTDNGMMFVHMIGEPKSDQKFTKISLRGRSTKSMSPLKQN